MAGTWCTRCPASESRRHCRPPGRERSQGEAQPTWRNSIGDSELATVWQDPDFDPKLSAFYYARVIEIPTPRWTLYDSVRYKIKMAAEVPMVIQERAFTSPIWYSPQQ